MIQLNYITNRYWCQSVCFLSYQTRIIMYIHDDVIKLKHFARYRPFVRGIHRSPMNSPHRGQLRGASMFSLTCSWINGWVNNREAGDLRHHRTHYDVTVIMYEVCWFVVGYTNWFYRYPSGLLLWHYEWLNIQMFSQTPDMKVIRTNSQQNVNLI